MTTALNALKFFNLETIPNLDVVVAGALELFQNSELPQIEFSLYQRPLVVGSGNAEATGRILFQDIDAIFASESNYLEKLNNINSIDGIVLISASGEKHAPIIAKQAKSINKPISLISNNPNSSTIDILNPSTDNIYIFPKNREPYTYNTSTYMGMLLSKSGENPAEIQRFIEQNLPPKNFPNFSNFNKYYLIVPPQFYGIIRMLNVKFIELFGRNIARDIETSEYVQHATTVVPSDELFISFGVENNNWGKPENRLYVPLPANTNYAAMMAIGYFVIGQIQAAHPPYFQQNIANYCSEISKIFGKTVSPIVE